MAEQQEQSFVDSIKQGSLDTAKELAPWRAGLSWWVVLIEGIVLGVIGILILIDPRQTTVNVALFLAAALMIAGIVQMWSIMRGKVPESIDALLAARAGIGIYAGGMVLLLFFLQYLGTESGLLAFGLGSLVYGLLGIWASIASSSRRGASAIVEGVFFSLFGVLLLYVLFAGGEDVQQVTSIVGWTAIVGGLALIGLSFYNRNRQQQAEEMQATAVAAEHKVDGNAKDVRLQGETPEEQVNKADDSLEKASKRQEEANEDRDKPKTDSP
jgi:uncharacterized membrane protein HdeD (DUF308 family)